MAYANYASITIDNTKVSGSSNLTDFPVKISGTFDGTGGEPDLRTSGNGGEIQNTDTGGNSGSVTVPADLAFYDDADQTTQLDHEVVSYDATTGEIEVWVRVPTLDYNDDTVIYMFYGDSGVTLSQEDVAGTWAGFIRVYHFNEGSGTTVNDSSGNGNGTLQNSDNWGTGQYDFDGVDDRINSGLSTLPEDMSVFMLVNTTDNGSTRYPMGTQNNGTNEFYFMRYQTGGNVDEVTVAPIYDNGSHGGSGLVTRNVNDGNWHMWGQAIKSSVSSDAIYDIFDASSAELDPYSNQYDGSGDEAMTYPLYFGGRIANGSMDGYMTMDVAGIFILDSVPSMDWHHTFYNTALGSAFFTMGEAISTAVPPKTINKGQGIYVV